jgi:hypothetical protein
MIENLRICFQPGRRRIEGLLRHATQRVGCDPGDAGLEGVGRCSVRRRCCVVRLIDRLALRGRCGKHEKQRKQRAEAQPPTQHDRRPIRPFSLFCDDLMRRPPNNHPGIIECRAAGAPYANRQAGKRRQCRTPPKGRASVDTKPRADRTKSGSPSRRSS